VAAAALAYARVRVHVQSVSLIMCHGVTDVSALASVPVVKLSDVRNVTVESVRALRMVKRLILGQLEIKSNADFDKALEEKQWAGTDDMRRYCRCR